jgi:NCS1 family nucleobase:cation symporter-1
MDTWPGWTTQLSTTRAAQRNLIFADGAHFIGISAWARNSTAPRKISFRAGGLITGVIGVVMMPWKLVADPSGYIFTWLVGYSALLGPIGGIMIADYYVYRRKQLHVAALYRDDGEYRFTNGFSLVAIFSLLVAILPNLPGFFVTVKIIDPTSVPEFLVRLYDYAWFVGFAIAFVVYLVLRTLTSESKSDPSLPLIARST